MIQGLSVLALITARGGSKGLPGKNLRPVNGRPLIDFTIAAARSAACVDRVVLSTDDDEIAHVAEAYGCIVPFRRPASLANDDAKSVDVVLDALDRLPPHDIVVLLQPTSPAREAADIDATVQRLLDAQAPSCVSVCIAEESPYWMFSLNERAQLLPILARPAATRRQDLPRVFLLNGAVYAARTDALRRMGSFVGDETVAYVMPRERSIDIDSLEDFEKFSRRISGEAL
ncbi:MAG: acylneuraminate cytidylyltransferase family protein [Betaproteobacteria bacterium]